ncbi:hypothetical protein R3P38DRAFT_3384792 [Favolaschia claudopus]|uniref:Structure-specific endonuclease subunit SLX1 n=1 Tax=Favolaschia claudopus TaxID=2862362 RepID=A0AAW0DYN1_9AGAR
MDHSRVTLSPIRSRDIPAIMQLHATLLPVSYPRSFFLHLLLQPSRLCLVARNNDDPIAFVSAVLHREQRLEILTLGVLPKFQQLHLATRLVYAVIDALTHATTTVTVFAQVSASNASAQAFYEHIGMAIKGARSSLLCHRFPSFYACYLLKSIQTPTSTATYIGSTPNPPKRIRQHNGELTQGAHKTKLRRPWVMQMIVHGFPSKLAALQFEWAWQHAAVSRHLRDENGKALLQKARTLSSNIKNVHVMLSTHPWSTWPLNVKLFTEAAVKAWHSANANSVAQLPPGFNYTIELEGVDGKSGQSGSGRRGPLGVDDAQFTSAHLAKNTALLASNRRLNCSICDKEVLNYTTEPLNAALCPTSGCMAVSHLSCLSQHFLSSQTSDTGIIPRGGHCKSCRAYVLWGDIVRGMYRRSAGGAVPVDEDELFLPDLESDALLSKSAKAKGKRKASPKSRQKLLDEDLSGESFDFNVSSSTASEVSPRRRGRSGEESLASPQKHPRSLSSRGLDLQSPNKRAKKTTTPSKSPSKPGRRDLMQEEDSSSEGEEFDFNVSSSTESEPAPSPRKRGKQVSRNTGRSSPTKPARVADTALTKRGPPKQSSVRNYHALVQAASVNSSDFFDSDSLGPDNIVDTIIHLKSSAAGPQQKLLLKPGEVDFFDSTQEDVSRAMSVLSVASPEDDVIILSD